jgi:hypothetical protein
MAQVGLVLVAFGRPPHISTRAGLIEVDHVGIESAGGAPAAALPHRVCRIRGEGIRQGIG